MGSAQFPAFCTAKDWMIAILVSETWKSREIHGYSDIPIDDTLSDVPMSSHGMVVTVRQANPWRAQVLSDAPKEEGEVGKEMMVLWI